MGGIAGVFAFRATAGPADAADRFLKLNATDGPTAAWAAGSPAFQASGPVAAWEAYATRDLDNRRTMNGTRITVSFTGPDGRPVSVRSPAASSVTTLKARAASGSPIPSVAPRMR